VPNGRQGLGGQVGGGLDRGRGVLEGLGGWLEFGGDSLALMAAEQVRLEVAGVIRVQGVHDPPGDLGVVEGVLDVVGHGNLARRRSPYLMERARLVGEPLQVLRRHFAERFNAVLILFKPRLTL
jgi:hypothetical protein